MEKRLSKSFILIIASCIVLGVFALYFPDSSHDVFAREYPDAVNDNPALRSLYVKAEVVDYALDKVGCAFDIASHSYHEDDLFDSSELVYLSYLNAGIDISYDGIYTNAQMLRYLTDNHALVFEDADLEPGDIIFFAADDSIGRYGNCFHSAIYMGNNKIVEAYGRDKGVIYNDLRMSNIAGIGRPVLLIK